MKTKCKNDVTDCTSEWKPRNWILPPGLVYSFVAFERRCRSVLADLKKNKYRQLLICGDTGVGKSMFTEYFVHKFQKNTNNKVVKFINCAAIPETLLESELFGYVKGAATGLNFNKIGYFEAAGDGIIILEEIGEMSKFLQAKLLTVIENRMFSKLGSTESIPFKAQVVATTNVDKKKFRPDFWYRFEVFTVPPLYKRRGDVLYYIDQFDPKLLQILSKGTIMSLMGYNWPGNVREVERVCHAARDNIISIDTEETEKYYSPDFAQDMLMMQEDHLKFEDYTTSFKYDKFEKFANQIKQGGTTVKNIDRILNCSFLSISNHASIYFDQSCKEYRTVRIDDKDEYISVVDVHRLNLAYAGSMVFCKLFFQDIYQNCDVLDFKTNATYYPPDSDGYAYWEKYLFYDHFTKIPLTKQMYNTKMGALYCYSYEKVCLHLYRLSVDAFKFWHPFFKEGLVESLKFLTGIGHINIKDVSNLKDLYQRYPSNKFLKTYFNSTDVETIISEVPIEQVSLDDLKELYYETICNSIGTSYGFKKRLAEIAGRTPGLITQDFEKMDLNSKFSKLKSGPQKRLVIFGKD